MIILGIDPSINETGWGVIQIDESHKASYQDSGIIKTKPAWTQMEKLCYLTKELKKLTQREMFSIPLDRSIVLEDSFVGINPKGSITLGMVRGVLIGAVAHEIGSSNIHLLSPKEVKKFSSGFGDASKDSVLKMVNMILKTKIANYNISDALAVALSWASLRKRDLFRA